MKDLPGILKNEDVGWIFADWFPEDLPRREGLIRSLVHLKNALKEQNVLGRSIESLNELPLKDLKWDLRRHLGEDKTLFKDAVSVERVIVLIFDDNVLRKDIIFIIFLLHLMENAARDTEDQEYEAALSSYVDVFSLFKMFKDYFLADAAAQGKNIYASEKQILSIRNRIEEILMRCLQHYLRRIETRSDKDILGFIEHIESLSGGTVSILKEFSEVLRIRLEERDIAFVIARSLDAKSGRIRTHSADHEVEFSLKSEASANNVRIEAVVSLGKKDNKLLMYARVMVEKEVTSIFVAGEKGDFYDILHNYLLSNRNELLEKILSIMYIVTPPDAVFYFPLSEQAGQSLKKRRKDDGSLVFIQKIAEISGFPPSGHKFVEIKNGYYLRCEKSRIFIPDGRF